MLLPSLSWDMKDSWDFGGGGVIHPHPKAGLTGTEFLAGTHPVLLNSSGNKELTISQNSHRGSPSFSTSSSENLLEGAMIF